MRSRLIAFAVLAMAFVLLPGVASADKRVALVIGNAAYKSTQPLGNPENDSTDIAKALSGLGFQVIFRRDLGKADMERALGDFSRMARDADAALFFYAGHGMQFQGVNYLMPVDARLEDEVSPRYEMVRIDDVRAAMDRVKTKIIVLDACRNNPLAEKLSRSIVGTTRDAGISRGLAPVQQAGGTLVAYATQANDVAADGDGRNSPFTAALLKEIKEPGIEVNELFSRVRQDVYTATNAKQLPELSVSLLSSFYLNNGETAQQAWSRVRGSSDPHQLEEFIARYPNSFLLADAKDRLKDLTRAEADKAAAEKAQQAREQALRGQIEAEFANRSAAERDQALKERLDALARDYALKEQVAQEAMRAEISDREEALKRAQGQNASLQAEIERLRKEAEASRGRLAALPQDASPPAPADPLPAIKTEMQRIGCYSGALDNRSDAKDWRAALDRFAKQQHVRAASLTMDAALLSRLKELEGRVCPLTCARGQMEKDGQCVARAPAAPRVKVKTAAARPQASRSHTKPAASGGGRCFSFNGRRFCE